jgi:hypothetical protein
VSERATAIQRWDGVEVTEIVEGAAPAVTESVPVAGECPPTTARVLNHLTIPPYVNLPEPTCEELQGSGWLDHGRRRRGMKVQRQ